MQRQGIINRLVLLGAILIGFVSFNAEQTTLANEAATGTSDVLPVGSSSQSIDVDGVTRTYRVFRPKVVDKPAPLVVMLHGGGGSGLVAEAFYGWDKLATEQHFIVAYPDALGDNIPAWNTGGNCCGWSGRTGVDDVGFIVAMVEQIGQQIPIDPSRIYATGISNGGILDYTLACNTDLFAAIGPVSATMLNDCQHPSPVSVIHIHGLQDASIRFDGSKGEGIAKIDGPPIPDVIDFWRKVDACEAATELIAGVVSTSISTCASGRTVELITIADAQHGWPGASKSSTKSTSGGKMPSQAVDSTTTIWEFFQAHPKPESA